MKTTIKKLKKPVKVIIYIRIRSYWDKTNGNNYCSARATVNNDYDNEVVYPLQYNHTDQCKREVLDLISKQFKGLAMVDLNYDSEALANGIYIDCNTEYTNQRDAKRFGVR